MLLTRVGNRIDSNRLRCAHRFGFVVVLSEPWPQATLVEESGSREAAIRTCRPLPPLNNTTLLKFTEPFAAPDAGGRRSGGGFRATHSRRTYERTLRANFAAPAVYNIGALYAGTARFSDYLRAR